MTRQRKSKHRLPRLQGQVLKANDLDKVWGAYLAARQAGNEDRALRNQLVEHYLPWAGEVAASIASELRMRDRENAVGEALAALVGSIVPEFDGRGKFTAWARICIQRIMITQRRRESVVESFFVDSPVNEWGDPLDLSEIPAAGARSNAGDSPRDLDFLAATKELSDRQAMVLWLRFQRGISVDATAEALRMRPGTVTCLTTRALAELRKKFGTRSFLASCAY